MLSTMINIILSLALAVATAFGSLFAAYVPSVGPVAVVSSGAVVTEQPTVPVVTPQPDEPIITEVPAVEGEYATIQRGQSGEAVLALQERLTELGYYTGKLTGKMDSPTQLAYKKFEKANGFNANGIASPEEQMVLFSEGAVAAE